MTTKVPKGARRAIRKLAARHRAELAQAKLELETREISARERRRLAMTAARDVLRWVREVAATGALDPAGDHGVEIYAEGGSLGSYAIYAVRDGTLRACFRSLVGASAIVAGSAAHLVDAARPPLLHRLGLQITSGEVWRHLEERALGD